VSDPRRPHAFHIEQEPHGAGLVSIATLFLKGRRCPWRCVMCDLSRHAPATPTPPGAIPEQIDHALENLSPAVWIKLYNAGSFFDRAAVPPADHGAIAQRLRPFERTIVECHPKLVGDDLLRFHERLDGAELEVAVGLETADPATLARLDKGAGLDDFARAARLLRRVGVLLRAFVLIQPPFQAPGEALMWVRRSADFAFHHGAETLVLIPTRPDSAELRRMVARGTFHPPDLTTVEDSLDLLLERPRGRVLVDLWGFDELYAAAPGITERRRRLEGINLSQRVTDRIGT